MRPGTVPPPLRGLRCSHSATPTAGPIPDGLKLRSWVPFVQSMRGRRRSGRSLLLDRRRLRDSGVEPTPGDDLKALPIIYVLLPYMGGFAQLQGWVRGRRARNGNLLKA